MRYQQNEYYCGPAALQNALRVLKHSVSQERIADLAGTTQAEGTDEEGLKRAALAVGAELDEFGYNEPAKAWGHLAYNLMVGRPTLLCVDRWTHWVTAIGLCGSVIILAEPARVGYSARENGILVVHRERFLRRWRAGRTKHRGLDEPRYYGIGVSL